MDFEQLDKRNIIYFPCNGKKSVISAWQELKTSKKSKTKTNYGVQCGSNSNISVVDIDLKEEPGKKSGYKLWNKLIEQFNRGEPLETPIVKTGSGGYHVYFKYNGLIQTGNAKVKGFDENGFKTKYTIDFKNDGGYVIMVGSIHPDSKKSYKYIQDFEDCEPMEMPDWIIDLLTKNVEITNGKIEFKDFVKVEKSNINISESADYTPPNFNEAIFKEIILSLDKNRANEYDEWIRVCWAVGSIDRTYGWDNLAELIEFSKKCPHKFDKSEVEIQYDNGNGKIGMGSLWHWLKEDNPGKFNELYRKHKELYKPNYFYGDYKNLMEKHDKNGVLHVNDVVEYLKGAFVKIDNGGNTKWLSRNQDDDGADQWEILKNKPFTDNKINIMVPDARKGKEAEENEDEESKTTKSSFYSILEKACVKSDYPIYNKVDFRPYLHESQINYKKNHIFNLFKGFPHKPEGDYDADLIAPILNHMKNILCAGNEDFYNYYIRYIAHAIQYPMDKPGTAIIFITPQGLGKDIIHYDLLVKVFGNSLLHRVNDLSEITRNFNKKLEGKLMTIVGEVRSFCNEADTEKLKGIITDTTINIEPKGKDPYEIKDLQRFIAHTNNSIPVGIKPDDRRFIIHKVSGDFVQTREYYNNLMAVINKPETPMNFFRYLAQMDLNEYDIRDRPYTVAKHELQILTAPNAYRFMSDVYNGEWALTGAVIKNDEIKIHTNRLYENYKDWTIEKGERKTTAKIFKQKLLECGFLEYENSFKIDYIKRVGYKTSKDEIYKLFKEYVTKKNIDDTDDSPNNSDDEF